MVQSRPGGNRRETEAPGSTPTTPTLREQPEPEVPQQHTSGSNRQRSLHLQQGQSVECLKLKEGRQGTVETEVTLNVERERGYGDYTRVDLQRKRRRGKLDLQTGRQWR